MDVSSNGPWHTLRADTAAAFSRSIGQSSLWSKLPSEQLPLSERLMNILIDTAYEDICMWTTLSKFLKSIGNELEDRTECDIIIYSRSIS